MRATEIIRGILDIIDQVEEPAHPEGMDMAVQITKVVPEIDTISLSKDAGEINRFRQIVDLLPDDNDMSPLSNSPNPKVADIDAVTTHAGGGVNGPKHPADIRTNAPSMFPAAQWKGE